MPNPQQQDFLLSILNPEKLSTVVDIGANPIGDNPPYKAMLASQLCRVIGFEPQQSALDTLLTTAGPLEHYLPYAIGDGGAHTLYQCAASGMSSLLEPDPTALALFNGFNDLGEVTSTSEVRTKRLDDVTEIDAMDMLKIDIQGSELAVFESGREKLKHAVLIQTEVSFMPLYRNQPMQGEIDLELRNQGFVPHAFYTLKRWPLAPFSHPQHNLKPVNQALEADIIYVRDFSQPDAMTGEQLKHLALLAHHCYASTDLALLCLSRLTERGLIPEEAPQQYTEHLFPQRKTASSAGITNYSVSFNPQ